jgi:hypothetical protein
MAHRPRLAVLRQCQVEEGLGRDDPDLGSEPLWPAGAGRFRTQDRYIYIVYIQVKRRKKTREGGARGSERRRREKAAFDDAKKGKQKDHQKESSAKNKLSAIHFIRGKRGYRIRGRGSLTSEDTTMFAKMKVQTIEMTLSSVVR